MEATSERGSDINVPPVEGEKLDTLTGTLCDGMFSYADEDKAAKIISECLKLCDESKDTLSQVLQTKYISNHTPFFWVIANLPESERTKAQRTVPPLLVKLLELCGDLLDGTQNDIVQGLFVNSDNPLYQLIRSKLPSFAAPTPKAFFQAESDRAEYNVSVATGSEPPLFELTFNIPRFYDRIIIDKEISYHFVAIGSLWRFAALATPTASESAWHFELTETYSKNELPPLHQYKRTVEVRITGPADTPSGSVYIPPKLQISTRAGVKEETTYSTVPNSTNIDLKHHALSKLYANPLISQSNRALGGTIVVTVAMCVGGVKKNLKLGFLSPR